MHILFAAFDVFPTAKGATTRIACTLQAIKAHNSSVTIACLGYGDMPRFQQEDHIAIRRCLAMHPNFLKRTELFGDFLYEVVDSLENPPDIVQFRDIWSGVPLLSHPAIGKTKKIFEVNGFASIELPMHYPGLLRNPVLLDRFRMMERECLNQVDRIITVSRINAAYLQHCQVASQKITIIPNIADTRYTSGHPLNDIAELAPQDGNSEQTIMYAGTLTPWQGVINLIHAFRLIADRGRLRLILACSTKKFLRPIRQLIKKLHVKNQVDIHIGLSREQLYDYYRKALFTVVPLTRCDRNELQGCCPLKILESMAVGTPVIASNLAVCQELIEHGADGWLVTPDSPRSLAYAMRTLSEDVELLETLGRKAQHKIMHYYTPKRFTEQLHGVYRTLF